MPNDDPLFSGQMDTQIMSSSEAGEEWAVDRILSHHGVRADALFEVKWKSGDVTWLPYYQITHLQALTEYLELLGVSKISQLPKGLGRFQQDDPQIFIGSIFAMGATPYSPVSDLLFSAFYTLVSIIKAALSFVSSALSRFCQPTFISVTLDLEYSMPRHPCIDHPLLVRLSPTHYLIKSPGCFLHGIVHVGQIADYVNFDTLVRTLGDVSQLQSFPLGYQDFSDLWNEGVALDDHHRFCTIVFYKGSVHPTINIPQHPVPVEDFFIMASQVGAD